MPLPRIRRVEPVAKSPMFAVEALHLEFSNGARRVYQRLAAVKLLEVFLAQEAARS